ncbi:hypothetical protein [Variovorax sp. GT1P44]|uniref:hypothetical protein n=1 Tax=Variovorax sp. GT1P44 TaxID=3443742 RepID=UPI003F47ECFC
MSRYRKIEVRTWSDEKFRNLSPLPASGQGLWFFLLTGPHTGPIPGLFRAGRAAMAEELGWEMEAFDEAFVEVSTQGMAKADFKAKLVWLPNALRHNKPESPNVVRSWRVELDLLPECALKREAISSMRECLEEAGESYVAAFDELFVSKDSAGSAKASAKPSAKAMPNQEQEQEQDKNSVAKGDLPTCKAQAMVDLYHEVLPELPAVRLMSEARKKALSKFWRWVLTSAKSDGARRATTADEALVWLREYFDRARDNDFLMGRTGRVGEHANWQCDLDFLLTEKGMKHVIEKTRETA